MDYNRKGLKGNAPDVDVTDESDDTYETQISEDIDTDEDYYDRRPGDTGTLADAGSDMGQDSYENSAK